MEKRTSQLKRVKIAMYVRQSPLEYFISFEMTYGALRNNNLRFPFNDYDNVRHTTEQFYTPTSTFHIVAGKEVIGFFAHIYSSK